ncbi:amidohydrolase family protein [Mucilaginibacter sp. X5P1]|uniref:amidohydrolase family protein n=1 Tax=Mucilaginibacter sp. X5P1 TaxID=2723088 RepID=UPI00160E4AC9|nr:amidohydrolase family protein [Mucilaginibacter sp. X5P1]MBB6138957.1 cytosine/adenosine deaminase-related metal-dependent hydrolase [Mucilaginibacter sp. X5P1]
MKSFKADYVFPVYAEPIKNGIVTVDDYGRIISVTDYQPASDQNQPLEHLSGIICPGFINTHCHLELSHLEGKVPTKTGLVDFIKQILKVRNADHQSIIEAAEKADSDMYDNGIVAVGDISNNNVTIPIKAKSKLYYHTFVEVLGFLPHNADELYANGLMLLDEFRPQSCSITPHAPYSVSKELFRLIKKYSDSGVKNLLSIHNQECDDENKFFRYKLGKFNELYEFFGMDTSHFKPQARNSMQSIIPLLTSKQDILMVHNTCTNLKDIYFLKRFDRKINWCFCPNANLYIENRVPKINLFIDQGFNITLGTDSLASNTKLCVLHEMKTIQQKFPTISTAKLMEWGTINGAQFLGIDNEKGSLEPGKSPGLNLITNMDGLKLTAESKVRRLI